MCVNGLHVRRVLLEPPFPLGVRHVAEALGRELVAVVAHAARQRVVAVPDVAVGGLPAAVGVGAAGALDEPLAAGGRLGLAVGLAVERRPVVEGGDQARQQPQVRVPILSTSQRYNRNQKPTKQIT